MTLKQTVLTLNFLLFVTSSLYSQCSITPQASITGSRCVGSELYINSNILPESVIWQRNGTTVSTQTVTLNPYAVTVAGGNGTGTALNQLYGPDRLYVDAAGVLYIPELTNNRVTKWLPGATSGIVVAGGNGAGPAANQFSRPSSCFVDQQGNIYVTDQNNKRVQKWAPGATTGVTVANDLAFPTDVFIDKAGNMYVSDQTNNVVKKYAPGATTGVVVAGDGNFGSAPTSLNYPTGIFVDDAGYLYVCDTDNARVQKFAPGSMAGTTIASGVTPLDVSVDCNGYVYIVDYWANRVVKYPPNSFAYTTVAGGNGQGTAPQQLNNPIGVFIVGNNNLYVADYSNHRVQRFSTSIDPRYTATMPGNYTVTVNYPCCPAYNESFEIYEQQSPVVNITTSVTDICPGEQVQFVADNTNSIVDPIFQWTLNGTAIGNNAAVYLTSTLKDKDQLYCILSSTKACTLPIADTSNTIQVNVFKPVPLQMDNQVFICPGDDTLLTVPAIYTSYVWQDNSTQNTLQVNQEGTYYVTVTDQCSNTFSDTVYLSWFSPASNFLPRDTTICSYDTLALAPSIPLSSFLWNDGSTASSLTVRQPGMYWLQARDENNCQTVDYVYIQTKTCPPKGIYMPNAFSPNSNGKNDVFKPVVYGAVKHYRLSIFNRYGQLIFNSTNPAIGWDGTFKGQVVDTGVYVWMCQYEPEGRKPMTQKGTVMVIK